MIYNLPNGNTLLVWSNCPAGLLRVTSTRYVLKLTGDDILTIISWLLTKDSVTLLNNVCCRTSLESLIFTVTLVGYSPIHRSLT